jgi:thioredoxin 2
MTTVQLDDHGIVMPCSACGQQNRLAYNSLGSAVRCGKCQQAIHAPDFPIEVASAADFDRLVAHASLPIVVDYWAPWCGPCRMVAPELQKVATRQAGRILVVKVNTDELADLGQRFGIMSIPTLAVFSGGREIRRASGARPANDIETFVEEAVASIAGPQPS